MNLRKLVNISRVIDVYLIPSLSNIILDYITCDSKCFNCPHKYEFINDYPYFRILSVKIRNKIPKYTRGSCCECKTESHNDIVKIIKNKNEMIEFREKYGTKDKQIYDKSRELIYYFRTYPNSDKCTWFSDCNILKKHPEVKEIYNSCLSGEKKRLESYKSKIGKIIKNKHLHKYLPLDSSGNCTYKIRIFPGPKITEDTRYLPGNETIIYELKEKKKNIFKFVGIFLNIGTFDVSEIVIEGIL